MLFLLGFMGVALDFGRLFVIKSELQTSMDSCALAAAQELDSQADALVRANNAGLNAGNQNRVDFQNANWGGLGQLVTTDITYRDANYIPTTAPAAARYAQCQHTQTGAPTWLLQALGAFSGNPLLAPGARNVMASAVATKGSAMSTCPIPVAAYPKAGGVAPDYGYTVGEWITLLMDQSAVSGGNIGWANLDGSNSASETVAEMSGKCGTKIGDTLGTPGTQTAVADVWNWRFGIYKNSTGPNEHAPDYSGYAYTTTNWPSGSSAYDGATPAGAHATAANYVTKKAARANCANTTSTSSVNACESIIGRTLNSFQKLAPGGTTAVDGHQRYGTMRRIVTVPVMGPGNHVADFLCMFMLQPLSIPMGNVQLEYLGNASLAGSPCVTNGLPGGSAGPLVPVLVR